MTSASPLEVADQCIHPAFKVADRRIHPDFKVADQRIRPAFTGTEATGHSHG